MRQKPNLFFFFRLSLLKTEKFSQTRSQSTQQIYRVGLNNKFVSVNLGDLIEETTDAIGSINSLHFKITHYFSKCC